MFDTLKYSRTLESVGIAREQAEAHVRMIAEIVEGDLATKQDIQNLQNQLLQLEYRLIIKLSAVMVTTVTLAIAVTVALAKLF